MKRLIVLTLFLSLVAACSNKTEPLETSTYIEEDSTTESNVDNKPPHVSDEQLVSTAIQAMNTWESYSSIYKRSAKEHPELDDYITNTELKFVEANNQIYKKYSDNYFWANYELIGNTQEGYYINNKYGNNIWEVAQVSLERPKIVSVVADILQSFVDEHDTFDRNDLGNGMAVTNIYKSIGTFETVAFLLSREINERQHYGTTTDLIDYEDLESESLYPITNVTLDLYTKDNFVISYKLVIEFDIDLEGTGLLIIEESFESINELIDIPLPNGI